MLLNIFINVCWLSISFLGTYVISFYQYKFIHGLIATSLVILLTYRLLKHASNISHYLGDPYGTIVITLASVCVEISMIRAVIFRHSNLVPVYLGYSSFALTMLALNFFGSLSVIINSLYNTHQPLFSRRGVNAYISFMTALIFWNLILPSLQISPLSHIQQTIIAIANLITCLVFLSRQNITHVQYFRAEEDYAPAPTTKEQFAMIITDTLYLLAYLFCLNVCTEYIASYCELKHIAYKLVGFIAAFIVIAPEGLYALKAAKDDKLMRSINLFTGTVVASLSLTLAALLLYNVFWFQAPLYIHLGQIELACLLCTLLAYIFTFRYKHNLSFNGILGLFVLIVYLSFI